MIIKIDETGSIKNIAVVNFQTGEDFAVELIGNVSNGYPWDAQQECFVLTMAQYAEWRNFIDRYEAAECRFAGVVGDITGAAHERYQELKGNLGFDLDDYPERLQELCNMIENGTC